MGWDSNINIKKNDKQDTNRQYNTYKHKTHILLTLYVVQGQ